MTTRGKKPPKGIVKEAKTFMQSVNGCPISGAHIISVGEFIEGIYLPWVKDNKKPSTYKMYEGVWRYHLKGLSKCRRATLKDVRTFDVQRLLDEIGQKDWARNWFGWNG
jgi:hypothetical protein